MKGADVADVWVGFSLFFSGADMSFFRLVFSWGPVGPSPFMYFFHWAWSWVTRFVCKVGFCLGLFWGPVGSSPCMYSFYWAWYGLPWFVFHCYKFISAYMEFLMLQLFFYQNREKILQYRYDLHHMLLENKTYLLSIPISSMISTSAFFIRSNVVVYFSSLWISFVIFSFVYRPSSRPAQWCSVVALRPRYCRLAIPVVAVMCTDFFMFCSWTAIALKWKCLTNMLNNCLILQVMWKYKKRRSIISYRRRHSQCIHRILSN